MSWEQLIWFALPALLCWISGAWMAWRERHRAALLLTFAGVVIFFLFILGMWHSLERPPLRTMGETRLWYTLFLPVAALVVYGRWRYKWILSFSTLMALVFVCINLLKPEIHSKTLMPALQSGWFAPHVILYMFAYALFGAAVLMALYRLLARPEKLSGQEMPLTDNLLYVGLSFLTLGMLFGALWAKEAWGHYWAWDPKETWAAITWLAYLLCLHLRKARPNAHRAACLLLIGAFLCLQLCWWGINYLPSAQGRSIHTYNIR